MAIQNESLIIMTIDKLMSVLWIKQIYLWNKTSFIMKTTTESYMV